MLMATRYRKVSVPTSNYFLLNESQQDNFDCRYQPTFIRNSIDKKRRDIKDPKIELVVDDTYYGKVDMFDLTDSTSAPANNAYRLRKEQLQQLEEILNWRNLLRFPADANQNLTADSLVLRLITTQNKTETEIELQQRFTINNQTVGISKVHQKLTDAKKDTKTYKEPMVKYTSLDSRATLSLPNKLQKIQPQAVYSLRNGRKFFSALAQTFKHRKRISLPLVLAGVAVTGAIVSLAAVALFFPPAGGLLAMTTAGLTMAAKAGIIAGVGVAGASLCTMISASITTFFHRRKLRNEFKKLANKVDATYKSLKNNPSTLVFKPAEPAQQDSSEQNNAEPNHNPAAEVHSYQRVLSSSYGSRPGNSQQFPDTPLLNP